MNKLKFYSHEIYTVITILLLLYSALFVIPDFTQKLALIYAFIFVLHEWEENDYPGGFFKMLFGDIMGITPVPSGEKLKQSRTYVYILLIFLTFTPYILHTHVWLILPVVYLGIFEGLSHSLIMPKAFKLNRNYTPGMVTALCQLAIGVVVMYIIITNGMATWWQYLLAVPILLCGLAFMALNGTRENGINAKEMPKIAKKRLKEIHGK